MSGILKQFLSGSDIWGWISAIVVIAWAIAMVLILIW